MIARKVNLDKDYDQIASWWKAHDWPVLPKEVLSNSGFVSETKDGIKVAATWIFPTNCPIYIMEWTVGNPDLNHELRNAGLKEVTSYVL